VGKIAASERVLRKPGRLAEAEREALQHHVTYGVLILKGVFGAGDIVDAVAYHHERWDGQGYPYGLPGPATPVLGRIMQICSAVAAMTMDRPYCHALPWEGIVAELRACAGIQFDPSLVEPFIEVARAVLSRPVAEE
jgi:HD-GYP domain-containing protein (c-di-GMP phosphodiesterase class II)